MTLRASADIATVCWQRVPEAGGTDDAEDGHGQQGCDSGNVIVDAGGDARSWSGAALIAVLVSGGC
jgi:hypothetical protein